MQERRVARHQAQTQPDELEHRGLQIHVVSSATDLG